MDKSNSQAAKALKEIAKGDHLFSDAMDKAIGSYFNTRWFARRQEAPLQGELEIRTCIRAAIYSWLEEMADDQ